MSSRSRISLLAAAGLFLLQLGWILSLPPHAGIDEFDHALRASSVAEGHWEPGDDLLREPWGRGDLIPVRSDVAESVRGACDFRSGYTGVYNCRPASDLGDGTVQIASAAARYNPVYYAVAGLAAAPFHGNANLYALRIASALLCSVLFFLAVWIAAGYARTRWPVIVLVLAALPTTVYSTAVAAPNGAEMIAGLGTWVALLALVDDENRTDGRRRSTYLLLGLFVALVANLHTTGLLWLGLTVAAVAVLRGPVAVLSTLRPRGAVEAAVAGLTAFAVAFEIVWVLVSRVNDPASSGKTYPGTPVQDVATGIVLWPLQAIGAYPLRNDSAPLVVYGLVLSVLVGLAVLALRRTALRSREVLTFGFVVAWSFLVPAVLTALTASTAPAAWQGRYGMPFTVGLLVLAGRLLDRGGRPSPTLRALTAVAVATTVVAHLISQWSVMAMLRAKDDLVESTGWNSPSPLVLVALSGLAAACWLAAVRDGSAGSAPQQPTSATRELVG